MFSQTITKCRSTITRYSRSFYDYRTRNETIFAPATTLGPRGSPLGVVRISGNQTKYAVQKITQKKLGSDVSDGARIIKPRVATLSKIIDPRDDELIDEGLILWFPSPRSYTGEDVCELHVHGSRTITARIMSVLGSLAGLRPADAGEFTRRAVVNGKISLLQAEGLSDLIASQTDQQRKLALQGLNGQVSSKYKAWIQELITILAHLEASIDFGEDEVLGEHEVVRRCMDKIDVLSRDITKFTKLNSRCRDLITQGVDAVILGRPNAGKSTLMNTLCRNECSIVSDLSGTTRDVVKHSFEIGGHILNLNDTAGIKDLKAQSFHRRHESLDEVGKHDSIEREGMRRALGIANKSGLILYVIDGNEVSRNNDVSNALLKELSDVLRGIQDKSAKIIHVIFNKMDLDETILKRMSSDEIESNLRSHLDQTYTLKVSFVSCKTGLNFEVLVKDISQSLVQSVIPIESSRNLVDAEYINERHLSLLDSANRHLDKASQLTMQDIDKLAQHVREAVDYLSRICGSISNEEVFDVIFRDFCIGK